MSKTKTRSDSKLSKNEAIICVVFCACLGCLFIFNNWNWNDSFSKEDAVELTARYDSVSYPQMKFNYVILYFTDYENQLIDGACVSEELEENLNTLEYGTTVYMLIDPKSGYVMELRTDEKILLEFDYAQSQMRLDRLCYLCLGVIMLSGSLWFAVLKLKPKRIYHR